MEIWKDIVGYESLYQISNLGRVKSIANGKDLIMNGTVNKGYIRVVLSKDSKPKLHFVHRLVLYAFATNPKNKKTINHINGLKADNRLDNLEWATHTENNQHAIQNGLNNNKGGKCHLSKIVLNTQTGIFYDCIKDAAKTTNFNLHSVYNQVSGIIKNRTNLIYV
jgi:hypothetical protein